MLLFLSYILYTQKDEPTVSTDIEESIDEYPAFEEPQKDEPLLSTDNAEFVEEHSAQDDAQKDEPIVSTNIEEVIDEYPVLEEQQQKDEPISSTNNEEFIEENSVQDDTEKDEPTVSTNIDEYPVSEEPQKDVSNDDQSTEEPLASENVSIIEPSTPIKDDQLTVESPISEDVQNVTDQLVEEHFASVDTEQLEKTQVDEPINSIEEQNVPDDDDVVRVEITTPENISTDASSDDFVVPTKNDEIPVDNFEAEYIQIKTPDDIISTDTQSDSEHILTDVPDENNTSTSNLISNAAAAVVEEEPSTPEPEVIISEVQNTPAPKQEVKKPKGKISIFDDSDSDDDFLNLSKKKKRPSKIPNIFDDEPKVTKAKLKTPLNEPDDIFEEFTISKISKQKSTTEPPKEPQQLSSIRSLLSTVGVNDDDDDDDDFLSSKPKVKIVDKHVNTTPPVPTSTDEINPFDEVDEPQSNIFGEEDEEEEETTNSIITTQVDESKVKPTVQSNIFDEEETTDSITITQIDESEVKPTVQSNLFDEEDELTTKVQVETNPFEEVKKPPRPIQRVQLEQNPFGDEDENENETNPFGEVEESIETNPFDDADEKNPFEEDEDESNPFREDDDDDTNPFNEVKRSVSNNPFDDDTDTTTVTTTKVQTFQPRYSVINYHPIPPGTKISQMNCSSSYIYFCTPDRRLFFAELHLEDPSQSFDWQQHGDLAERLVVSTSNQTVWRLFNKCLYIANDPINYPPFGSHWNTVKIDDDQSLLSMSISDQCGWYVKEDGTLWFIRTDDKTFQSTNVPCPYTLDIVFCFSGKVGVTTNIGEILIRAGCTYDCPEGGGWLFIEKSVGFIDDFVLLTNRDIMVVMDKKHRLWMNEWSTKKDFHEILLGDDFDIKKKRYLLGINTKLLYITDCEKGIYVYSDSLTGVQWNIVEESSPNLRLFAAFPNEDYVWAITSNRLIGTSAGQTLDKPAAVDSLTHASFVPNTSSKKSILWALDQSCGIYVRSDIEKDTIWEQADETQFEKRRRLVNIVCNNFGVWAVDDRGSVHFRHGHISASQHSQSKEKSLLPPAWITVPGDAKRFRSFVQVFCGPQDWMVYATDTKQNVYTRIGITATDRVGSSWKLIDDCSALELAISEHRLWLLTSHGQIQCRENISLENPIGTRSATLSGHFRSLTVSLDDSQVWALDAKRNLLKLDRLTVLFKK